MVKCYAKVLGDCGNVQSGEHPIPRGIWRSDNITMDGLPWIDGKPVTLPIKGVKQKILCGKHNSALSPLDSEGQRLFRTLGDFNNRQLERHQTAKRTSLWKADKAVFNGHVLERLFAKMAIGMMHNDKAAFWHATGRLVSEPPREILDVIFNGGEFQYPMGLYFINSPGDPMKNEDRVTIETLLHPITNGLIGATIGFRHWQFFINLSDLDLSEYTLQSVTGRPFGLHGAEPVYRRGQLRYTTKGKISGVIDFDWN